MVQIETLNAKQPYVYLKLFGDKQVFVYHNFLQFKSPWTLQIMLLPIQQPTARGRMKEVPSHTILTLHNTVSVIIKTVLDAEGVPDNDSGYKHT